MEWLRALMLPAQGSEFAKEVDLIYMGLFVLCALLFIGITGAALYFSWRFRYRPGRVTPHITHNTPLELLWTVLPLLLCVVIFFIGLKGWMEYSVAPGDAMERSQITAKKWLWQFEYPDGSRTINDLHVPFNKPVKFTMTSEDVLHDFFVPVMRVKHDIIPGRYTQVWFQPNVMGVFDITCAEYCGKGHSDMRAKLTVEDDAAYARISGNRRNGVGRIPRQEPVAGMGQDPVGAQGGCNSCHAIWMAQSARGRVGRASGARWKP